VAGRPTHSHQVIAVPSSRHGSIGMIVLVNACVTPYQAMGPRGGYTDEPVAGDAHFIDVDTNLWTSSVTAIAYSYRRASEVCPQGFDVLDTHRTTYDVSAILASSVSFLIWSSFVTRASAVLVVRCRANAPLPPKPETPRRDWWCTSRDDGFGLCMDTSGKCTAFVLTGAGGADYGACVHQDRATCAGTECFNSVATCRKYEQKLGRDGSACADR
jgi:hypothetical protein